MNACPYCGAGGRVPANYRSPHRCLGCNEIVAPGLKMCGPCRALYEGRQWMKPSGNTGRTRYLMWDDALAQGLRVLPGSTLERLIGISA